MKEKFKIIVGNKKNNNKYNKISLSEYDNLSVSDKKSYLEDARNIGGYRIKVIKKLMCAFDFEMEDNMIDISFLYNLTDNELCYLYKLLYKEEM